MAGEVLRDPDSIELVWITGKDGAAMLVRRYRSENYVVDLGRAFWRWSVSGSAGLPVAAKPGLKIWKRA